MSIKYMKLKPSDDIYERLNIKSFSIEHINLFSKKKEMEVLIKIIHIDAFKEVMDLRRELTKTFKYSYIHYFYKENYFMDIKKFISSHSTSIVF